MVVRRWRWKHKTRTAVLLVVVLLLGLVAIRLPSQQVRAQTPVHYITVTVRQGDTVWTLAAPYLPENEDIRRFVDSIIASNGLNGSLIRPGQQIRIPVYAPGS